MSLYYVIFNRRLFTTLNRYAKPVSKMQIIALDEDDAVAIVTRRLMDKYALFRNWISIKKGKNIPHTDRRNLTTIVALYDCLDRFLSTDSGSWREFKKLRPSDAEIKRLYKSAVDLGDQLIAYFPPLAELANSSPDDEVAARYRNKEGGHLLFRPVGLSMVISVVRYFIDDGHNLAKAVRQVAKAPMMLNEDPWVGLLFDPVNRRMTVSGERQKVGLRLLYHGLGGDLDRFGTTSDQLRTELAGLLLKSAQSVVLKRWAHLH